MGEASSKSQQTLSVSRPRPLLPMTLSLIDLILLIWIKFLPALSRADGDFSTIAHCNTSQYASVFCWDKKRSLPICWLHLAVHAWQLYKRDDSAIGKRGTTADQWGSPEPAVKSHRMNHLCRIKREPNDTPLPTNENKERTRDGASPVNPSCVLAPVCKQQNKMLAGREGADKTT